MYARRHLIPGVEITGLWQQYVDAAQRLEFHAFAPELRLYPGFLPEGEIVTFRITCAYGRMVRHLFRYEPEAFVLSNALISLPQ